MSSAQKITSAVLRIRMISPLILLLASGPSHAETSIEDALKEAKSDLNSTLATLEKTRTEIAAEKPELSAVFQKIEQELREKRRLARIARLSKDDRAMELRQLQADLNTRRQDATYLAGLLKDHALKTTTLSIPGAATLDVKPETIAASANVPAEALAARLSILDASLSQLEELLGGSTASGQAADPEGKILDGTLAAFGPVSYFLSSDKSKGGDIVASKSGGAPSFVPGDAAAIASLISGNETTLPLDPTGGNARAMDEIDGGPLDLVRKGGLWIWPIIFLAVLSIIFGLIKLSQFVRLREPSDAWVTAILAALRTGDRQKAAQLAIDQNHPAGPVMEKLVIVSENSADLVEETLYEQLMNVQSKASTLLPVIAITAATAPLLGLLGTVSGMISTFNLITLFGSGDPKPLAGGISEALITTLFGLVVAIPALVLHAFLSRRAQGIVQTTERLGLSFVNGLRAK
ncbi:MotA/TolQ/ExbB proton channel family protein [Luteolibacter algae]|uniref:MotA/TolQ/ExbB proton channel family protein n=1 Tax=Luteolibacter algae TaxID=454151 RepID=A0ABW5D441_9BACT